MVIATLSKRVFQVLLMTSTAVGAVQNVTFEGLPAQLYIPDTPSADTFDTCYSAFRVDFVGSDIGNMRAERVFCCHHCLERKDCSAYTYTNYEGGTCWFKSSNAAELRIVENAVSVYTGQSPTHVTIPRCDMTGNDVGSVRGASFNDCFTPCRQRSTCKVFTWSNYNGGTCWLKSVASSCVRSDDKISVVLFWEYKF